MGAMNEFKQAGAEAARARQSVTAKDRKDWVVQKYVSGLARGDDPLVIIDALAEDLGCVENTVRRYITRSGISIPPRQQKRRFLADVENQAMCKLMRLWGRPEGQDEAIREVVCSTRRVLDHVCNTPARPRHAPPGFVPCSDDQPRVTSFRDLLRRFVDDSAGVVG